MTRNSYKTVLGNRKGFTTIAVAAGLIAIMGMTGLAVDVGRMYYAKSELQLFCDQAVLTASLYLDGTAQGISDAQGAVTSMATTTKWDVGTKTINNISTTFARSNTTSINTPDAASWSSNPSNPDGYRFVQVYASVAVPLTFMQVIRRTFGSDNTGTSTVAASAIGGQAMITTYLEGLLPFSPIAPAPTTPDNFGLVPGQSYTIRYPSPGNQNNSNVCVGDRNQGYWANLPSQDRGYWGSTSASVIRGEVINDEQLVPLYIGEPVPMVGGAKNTEGDALDVRVRQDSNSTAATFANYKSSGTGNGRRIIGLPINSGPNIVAPYDDTFIAVGIGAFFLQAAGTYNGLNGNDAICAEYIGPYVKGRWGGGAGQVGNSGGTGGYVVRLMQ
jgi:Flp pilus assembly protein TadG